MWNWKNMMKRFSTRADKWLYVFALISHIFNFFAESRILFLYHIVDHQKDHLFSNSFIQLSNQFSNHLLFILLVHSYHLFSFFFFKFIFIIFLLLFFSFCFSFLFLSVLLFFFFFFQSRRSSESRFSSFFVICSISKKSKNLLLLLLFILLLFLFFLLQNVSRH